MGNQPVSLVDLQIDAEASLTMPQYPIKLNICHNCTHVFNAAFVPSIVEYAGAGCLMYNEGSNWREHITEIAELLAALNSDHIIEIGAGDCSFLYSLKYRTDAKLLAIDPCEAVEQPFVPYCRELFDTDKHLPLDSGSTLVVMRHLLEHLPNPADLIHDIAIRAWERHEPTWGYIEVPCCENALERSRIEDWTYEHPQHFTENSLRELLNYWDVDNFTTQHKYGGEVLCCLIQFDSESNIEGIDVCDTLDKFKKVKENIKSEGEAMRSRLGEFAFWGGAGKSAMFIRQFELPSDTLVVDSDKAKWGMYVPGTRILIQPPSNLNCYPGIKIIATTSWRAEDIRDEIIRDNIDCSGLFKFADGQLVEVPLGN
jgi:hypothetical protein